MLLIKNGSVHLQSGKTLAGHDILVEGKIIKKIGQGLTADGAKTIDAAGLDVFPGFVLPVSSIGVIGFSERMGDNIERSGPVTPHMDIEDSFNIDELGYQYFGRCGITAYGMSPGHTTLIAGQTAVVHTHGKDVFLLRKAGIKANYTLAVKTTFGKEGKMPYTRMAMHFMLDDALREAKEYMNKEKKDFDPKMEALVPVLKGEIPLIINAHIQREIEAVAELSKKYGVRVVIHGAYQIDRCWQRVLDAGCHVALGDLTYYQYASSFETDYKKIVELYRRGLKLSLSSCNDEGYASGYEPLFWSAAILLRNGATADEVMDMMTINAARALGADHLIGSLEEGKQADMQLCRGNPLVRFDACPVLTLVGGEIAYEKEAD